MDTEVMQIQDVEPGAMIQRTTEKPFPYLGAHGGADWLKTPVAKVKVHYDLPTPPISYFKETWCAGADPEFFAVNKDGSVLPAWEFLPSKKSKAQAYWDGFQGEFTTTPGYCLDTHNYYICTAIRDIALRLNNNPGAYLSIRNTVELDSKTLKGTEKKYVEFGCKPSINVYNDPGDTSVDPYKVRHRFAGGHMHFGFAFPKYKPQIEAMTRALDGVIGLASVGMAASFDHPIRRKYYGRAGEIRLPKHGLEYRVLSNFWLAAPPIAYLVWEIARVALQMGAIGLYPQMAKLSTGDVKQIINECDVKAARKAVEKNWKMFEFVHDSSNIPPGAAWGTASNKKSISLMKKCIMEGIESVVELTDDLSKNWRTDLLSVTSGIKRWATHVREYEV